MGPHRRLSIGIDCSFHDSVPARRCLPRPLRRDRPVRRDLGSRDNSIRQDHVQGGELQEPHDPRGCVDDAQRSVDGGERVVGGNQGG